MGNQKTTREDGKSSVAAVVATTEPVVDIDTMIPQANQSMGAVTDMAFCS